MITKRTLEKYRVDALKSDRDIHSLPPEGLDTYILHTKELNRRILRLTQELLDLDLVRKG